MAVQIQIDQSGSGAPPGTPGIAREDLSLGFPVQLSAIGGPYLAYQWSIIDKTVDIVSGAQSVALLTSPSASNTPITPIDIEGTYYVQVLVDSGSGLGALPEDIARITFYAGSTLNALATDVAELPRREMAFRETTEHNVPDAVFPAGNSRGWAQERQRWQEVLKRIYAGKSWAWAGLTIPVGGPVTVDAGFNIAGATWIATGTYEIVFTRPLPNAAYAVIANDNSYADTKTVNGFLLYHADSWGMLTDEAVSFEVKAAP